MRLGTPASVRIHPHDERAGVGRGGGEYVPGPPPLSAATCHVVGSGDFYERDGSCLCQILRQVTLCFMSSVRGNSAKEGEGTRLRAWIIWEGARSRQTRTMESAVVGFVDGCRAFDIRKRGRCI